VRWLTRYEKWCSARQREKDVWWRNRQLNTSATNYVIDFCRQRRLIVAPLVTTVILCFQFFEPNHDQSIKIPNHIKTYASIWLGWLVSKNLLQTDSLTMLGTRDMAPFYTLWWWNFLEPKPQFYSLYWTNVLHFDASLSCPVSDLHLCLFPRTPVLQFHIINSLFPLSLHFISSPAPFDLTLHPLIRPTKTFLKNIVIFFPTHLSDLLWPQ